MIYTFKKIKRFIKLNTVVVTMLERISKIIYNITNLKEV